MIRTYRYSGYFSSVSCHPTERTLAVAQDDGAIRFWNCLPETPSPHANITYPQELHWHHHGPTIAYNYDGVYLLSAGREGVLVLWQLSTGKRQFLPDIDAPVVHISLSPDYKYYCLTTRNNKLLILHASSLKLHTSISGLCDIVIEGAIPNPTLLPLQTKLPSATHSYSFQLHY
jgi:NET1-associated nuclear protein 1 (U3 small nucleolar RNA-associated protein 17)